MPRLAAPTRQAVCVMLMALVRPALAGPPYVSDDPEPTDYKHFKSIRSATARARTPDQVARPVSTSIMARRPISS
jgi:hypothetical protein